MTPERQAEIERWFARRGVPQLIEEFTAERQLDTRAFPLLAGWVVLGTVLFWGTNPEWSIGANLAASTLMLAFIGAAWLAIPFLSRRPRWRRGQPIPAIEIFGLGPLIAIPAAVIDGDIWAGIDAGLNALLGIGIIYVVISLGLLEIGRWGLGRLQGEAAQIIGLLARTLPMLLILVLFLLFAAELWEAAHAMSETELIAVIFLVVLVAVLLVSTAFRPELAAMQHSGWDPVLEAADETPAEPLIPVVDRSAPLPPLTGPHRLNLYALVTISQLIQSLFVGLLVTAFLVVFGILALPATLQERWVGEAVAPLLRFELLDEVRILSAEHVRVSTLLGTVVGLYFTGLAVTDASYREAHFSRIVAEIRPIVAGRAVYASLLRRRSAGVPDEGRGNRS